MRVITGCCWPRLDRGWPKGSSRGGVLAACCEGSQGCRCRTGNGPGPRTHAEPHLPRNCVHGDPTLTPEGACRMVLRKDKVEIGNSGHYIHCTSATPRP